MAKKSPAERLALVQISEEPLLMRDLVARLNIKLHDLNCVAQQLSDLLSVLIVARISRDDGVIEKLLDEIIRDTPKWAQHSRCAGKRVH